MQARLHSMFQAMTGTQLREDYPASLSCPVSLLCPVWYHMQSTNIYIHTLPLTHLQVVLGVSDT